MIVRRPPFIGRLVCPLMPFSLRLLLLFLLSLLLLVTTVWVNLGLWYQLEGQPLWRASALVAWTLFGLATAVLACRHEWRGVLSYAMGFALYLGWWTNIQPQAHAAWADDVARTLHGQVMQSQVQLENVRSFDWRSETDYSPQWVSRQYDLDALQSVDMALSYWMGPAIAHTLVSFGFSDGRYLTFSIEIRKQKNQSYSAVAGFFKYYQTSLIAAEESDILRTRSNARGEDVYLYRVQMKPETMRSLFLAYVAEANNLAGQARFYNTLDANCTTVVYEMLRRISPGLPMDWRILLSGYLPEYLYDLQALPSGHDLAELRAAGHISSRAQQAPNGAGFSAAIRVGIPGMATP